MLSRCYLLNIERNCKMQNSIVDLSGMSLEGLTPDNFHDRTTSAGLNGGRGFRLRITAEQANRVKSGQSSLSEVRQTRLDEILALQASRTSSVVTTSSEDTSNAGR